MSKSISEMQKAAKKFKAAEKFEEWLLICGELYKQGDKESIREFRRELTARQRSGKGGEAERELLKRGYLVEARDNFDCFLIYVEWNRPQKKQFYLPRRKQLLPIVKGLQRLAEGEISLLCVSCPPGIGKTALAIFFLCWLAGRNPDKSILGGSHNNAFLRGVYDECLRLISDEEYLFYDVFPESKIAATNAKDMRIDLGKAKRFETLEFTSIGSGNAGKVRAMQLLYCDDLVDGIETAMSKVQLDKLWQTYYTDLRQRKQGDCCELHIATRWSVHDIIGRLEAQYGGDPSASFIRLPAVDEEGNSNFDYPFGLGFTTEDYREQREIMDTPSWKALYMNEPIEREGLLYEEGDLRRFLELPEDEPEAVIAVCDTKSTGEDYCFCPIAYKYGEDYYIADCVCDNGDMRVIEDKLVNLLVRHQVKAARFESNAAGARIAQGVQEKVKAKGGHCAIQTRYTTSNKLTKIIVNAPWVKEHCLFADKSIIKSADYRDMLNLLCSFTQRGKNAHDDVPDGMAMLAEYVSSLSYKPVEIRRRLF